jgi:hypothetical protein
LGINGHNLGFGQENPGFYLKSKFLNHVFGMFEEIWFQIMRAFSLYSFDKIQLQRIMLSCFSQLEFPVVSGQHTLSKYKSLVHMSSLVHFSCGTKSQLVLFSLDLKNYPFRSAIYNYLDLVSYLMEPTGTGQVNVQSVPP